MFQIYLFNKAIINPEKLKENFEKILRQITTDALPKTSMDDILKESLKETYTGQTEDDILRDSFLMLLRSLEKHNFVPMEKDDFFVPYDVYSGKFKSDIINKTLKDKTTD